VTGQRTEVSARREPIAQLYQRRAVDPADRCGEFRLLLGRSGAEVGRPQHLRAVRVLPDREAGPVGLERQWSGQVLVDVGPFDVVALDDPLCGVPTAVDERGVPQWSIVAVRVR
jgi:hypothetical protein